METTFTPWAALGGGILIGLGALLLMATTGRIAGISGITARILPPAIQHPLVPSSLSFLAGLLLAAPLIRLVSGSTPVQQTPDNLPLLIVAGLLVGFGTVLGSGCTSGHGVCGISRFSPRSTVSIALAMFVGMVAVYVVRHGMGG